eukprot:TRINITY_DN2666_c0_g3_i1.p1 TRINITY_DN2666_c0_g3~~TRINITY_DN2666_c0_g3_i1.p1  ORF type:complete len:331 (-),score=17.36 TRINITY_DN2666_c0_g3_i1:233-1180(-)
MAMSSSCALQDSVHLYPNECSPVAPWSKAQQRLHRRKLCWLRYIAFNRNSMLAMRTIASQESFSHVIMVDRSMIDETLLAMRPSSLEGCVSPSSKVKCPTRDVVLRGFSIGTQTDITDGSSIGSHCTVAEASCSSVGVQTIALAPNDSMDVLGRMMAEAEARAREAYSSTPPASSMDDPWRNSVPSSTPLPKVEQLFYEKGAVVLIDGLDGDESIPSHVPNLGIIIDCTQGPHRYSVMQLSSGQICWIPPSRLEDVQDGLLCCLVKHRELNGQYVLVDGYDSRSERIIVELLDGRCIKIKPTNLDLTGASIADTF